MSNIIGARITAPSASLTDGTSFGLGDRFTTQDGREYVYVQANGAVTGAGYVVVVDEDYQAALLSTSNDARGDLVAIAPAAFADNDYGWVQVKGPCVIRVAASCAANARVNTTATAGQVDDDGTTGAFEILGAVLTTANGGSAGTAAGILNYPSIGPVLP
jgi:hypothetical protein